MKLVKKTLSALLTISLALSALSSNVKIVQAYIGPPEDSSTRYSKSVNARLKNSSGFTNLYIPTVFDEGNYCSISGQYVKENKSFTLGVGVCSINNYSESINSKIYNTNRNYNYTISEKNYNSYSQANLSDLDSKVYFNKLPHGKYCFYIYKKANNTTQELYKCQFIVKGQYEKNIIEMNNIAFSDYNIPLSSLYYGNSFSLYGRINILYPDYATPTEVTGYIFSSKYSSPSNALYSKSSRLYFYSSTTSVPFPKEIDNKMYFNWLDYGDYAYSMSLKINNTERYMIVKPFSVK